MTGYANDKSRHPGRGIMPLASRGLFFLACAEKWRNLEGEGDRLFLSSAPVLPSHSSGLSHEVLHWKVSRRPVA